MNSSKELDLLHQLLTKLESNVASMHQSPFQSQVGHNAGAWPENIMGGGLSTKLCSMPGNYVDYPSEAG
jgi:hypothetical protein